MNENSSKQVLLSVLGIAVLVVAVVGVSFAFFTYSKTGEKNNTLTTGNIFFNFTEGNAITLTNEFPRTDTSGEALTEAQNGALTFHVVGYDSSEKGIEYTVYALQGDADADATKTRFKDSEIKLNLKAPATVVENKFATSNVVGIDGSLANGVILAKGKITAKSSATQQDDEYTLRMWISDAVTIGEAASDSYTTEKYAKMYYSLKLKVVAATTGTTQPGV